MSTEESEIEPTEPELDDEHSEHTDSIESDDLAALHGSDLSPDDLGEVYQATATEEHIDISSETNDDKSIVRSVNAAPTDATSVTDTESQLPATEPLTDIKESGSQEPEPSAGDEFVASLGTLTLDGADEQEPTESQTSSVDDTVPTNNSEHSSDDPNLSASQPSEVTEDDESSADVSDASDVTSHVTRRSSLDDSDNDDDFENHPVNANGSRIHNEPLEEMAPPLTMFEIESEDDFDDEHAVPDFPKEIIIKSPNTNKRLANRLFLVGICVASLVFGAKYIDEASPVSTLGKFKYNASISIAEMKGAVNASDEGGLLESVVEGATDDVVSDDISPDDEIVKAKPVFAEPDPSLRRNRLLTEMPAAPETPAATEAIVQSDTTELSKPEPIALNDQYSSFSDVIESKVTMVSATNPQFILAANNTRLVMDDSISGMTITAIAIDSVEITTAQGESVVLPFN